MKVLVAEAHESARAALVDVLADLDGVTVCGAVPDLARARRALARGVADIVVTGEQLTDGDAIQLIRFARRFVVRPTIVVVGDSPARDHWRRYLLAGADRYVDRDSELRELCSVVADVVGRDTAGAPHRAVRFGGHAHAR